MKKVLITGANGYLGARLCSYLADEGFLVTALCYPEAPADSVWRLKLHKVIAGDLRDDSLLATLAQEERYDVLIHLVSLDHRASNEGMPSVVAPVNVTPVWSLLHLFSKHNLKRFLYLSTVHVYGVLPNKRITEQQPAAPATPYALTHMLGEALCDYYNRTSDVECLALRLSNSYGAPVFRENNCWWLVINDLCRMAYEEKKMVLTSDGTPLRDFIHGWDVCKAVKHLLADAPKGIYHLSSGATLTIEELARKIQTVYQSRYGRDLPLSMTPSAGRPDRLCVSRKRRPCASALLPVRLGPRYLIDNQKLLSTGYTPDWSLERGIYELFDYLETPAAIGSDPKQ